MGEATRERDDDVRSGALGERHCEECGLVRHAHAYMVPAIDDGFAVEAVELACDHDLDPTDETITTAEKRDLDARGDVRLELLGADE
ncbi:hypothetical protein [Candidatus Halobonum tyrrellensis]|uniref:hypothetical protein n=1 Tax=Candidatus Halobonum tyrrellensis TaxID=1431545 RepID=UPI001267EB0D|nr:hypothetical protein [Candidatus Halobonum tyrrellensis]